MSSRIKLRNKSRATSKTFSCFLTKQQLIEAQQKTKLWDFNRQIDARLDLTALGDLHFPVTFVLPHNHRHFEPCEDHFRILVFIPTQAWERPVKLDFMTDPTHLLFDVSAGFFQQLGGMWIAGS